MPYNRECQIQPEQHAPPSNNTAKKNPLIKFQSHPISCAISASTKITFIGLSSKYFCRLLCYLCICISYSENNIFKI